MADSFRERGAAEWPGAEAEPLAYPGARPEGSFLVHGGRVLLPAPGEEAGFLTVGGPVDRRLAAAGAAPLAGRIAVLAVGSNACPGRLVEKFGDGGEAAIPVAAGLMPGVAAVYMAALASYGAVPATAWPAPGGATRLWITLLDREQLEHMNATESVGTSYRLIALEGVFETAGGAHLAPVYAYRAPAALELDGGPVRLAAFAAEGNVPAIALDQPAVLARVLDRLGILPGLEIGERHRRLAADPDLRRETAERMARELGRAANDEREGPAVPSAIQPARWTVSPGPPGPARSGPAAPDRPGPPGRSRCT